MIKIELVLAIGDEVCEGCGPDADCGEYPDCFRLENAVAAVEEFIKEE